MKTRLGSRGPAFFCRISFPILCGCILYASQAPDPPPELKAELAGSSRHLHVAWRGSPEEGTLHAADGICSSTTWSPLTGLVDDGNAICAALPLDRESQIVCVRPSSTGSETSRPVKPVFITAAASQSEIREVALLVDSVRAFGGAYRSVPVHVVLANSSLSTNLLLNTPGVHLRVVEMDEQLRSFPFALKVHACAQMEAALDGVADWMVWFDPRAVMLAPPKTLDAPAQAAVSIRPVHYQNIGSLARVQPDLYWRTIYAATGVDTNNVWTVQSFVDGQTLRAYYNCAFMACRPERGLMRAWQSTFSTLLKDPQLRSRVAGDSQHSTYLHQAILSGVILARVRPEEINDLPAAFGYPLSVQSSIPRSRRAERLSELVVALYEGPLASCLGGIEVDPQFEPWLVAHGIKR